MGPRLGLDILEIKKIFASGRVWTPDISARDLVTYPVELFQLYFLIFWPYT